MKIKFTIVALALAAACGPAPGFAHSPSSGSDRLVGLWHVSATLAPCAGGPSLSFLAINTYHSGGTLASVDNMPMPSSGPAQGIWEYAGHGRYRTHTQLYRFLPDGSHDGLTDVYQDLATGQDGHSYTSTMYGQLLNVDGTLRVELCGTAQGTRVSIDSNP